ncbi:squalene cyclase [Hymenobacter chitinivorans DSM 11115]|uniref:Squalene cyclase n=2 Tax=Hymenobacter chitinivorans TaxID=89969 RepID=A0A2M9B5C0_9BACT|nr:squalene cyclase [Hymenobacter chitinivorans DSM 11115]
MIDISKVRFSHLEKTTENLRQSFLTYLDDNVSLPGGLKHLAFPNSFFDSEYYLTFPYLFRKAFGERNSWFVHQVCVSGFFYFKYLLCLDAMHDKDDISGKASAERESHLLLQSHIYHEESLKILSKHFGKKDAFWVLWNQRNYEFLASILLDKEYNVQMSFDTYTRLAINKCAFSKVGADAYYAKNSTQTELHRALTQSLDYFSIARCIQDDLEDFKKDLQYQKNNLGHIFLQAWLKSNGKKLKDYAPEVLERYLFTSETAERMMTLSKSYYQRAIDEVEPYRAELTDYIKIIDLVRNKINFYKVNVQAYRVNKLLDKIISTKFGIQTSIQEAITRSKKYIERLQGTDGSWFEVTNMQGLSNVWATGFVASYLEKDNPNLVKATEFLLANQQDHLWGYNTDWVFDFDSTTCVLFALHNADQPVQPYLVPWFEGQTSTGGFRTYSDTAFNLVSQLGLKKTQLNGWTSAHICVSALAYYFLNHLEDRSGFEPQRAALKAYILENKSAKGVWQPYWWTSYLYPTCFVVQAMLRDEDDFAAEITQALDYIIRKQNKDGSFSCEILKQKSVFYTALVLDTISASPALFATYQAPATRMKDWLLANQYEDGGFTGSNFLVIPNPTTLNWYQSKKRLKINKAGGGNSITGEIANLFSTAVSLRALQRYNQLDTATYGN